MTDRTTRRRLIRGAAAACALLFAPPRPARARPVEGGPDRGSDGARAGGLPDGYPQLEPEAVRSVVGASHGDLDRVRALVDERPELAKASWDWGFGDRESALGAASHTGNREIALYLIERGARPTLFSAAMLGQLAVVRAFVEASPGVQGTPGPHGIPLLVHARLGGERAAGVVAYLEGVGGADGAASQAPLPVDAGRLVGRYVFDPSPTGAFELSLDDRGRPTLARAPDGTARVLLHRGDLVFEPPGAPSARIRVALAADGSATLEIHHPGLRVRAVRRSSAPDSG